MSAGLAALFPAATLGPCFRFRKVFRVRARGCRLCAGPKRACAGPRRMVEKGQSFLARSGKNRAHPVILYFPRPTAIFLAGFFSARFRDLIADGHRYRRACLYRGYAGSSGPAERGQGLLQDAAAGLCLHHGALQRRQESSFGGFFRSAPGGRGGPGFRAAGRQS